MASKFLRTTLVCSYCDRSQDLTTCPKCKIVRFCSKACEARHLEKHGVHCETIEKFTADVKSLEQKLRDERYVNFFEVQVGHFGFFDSCSEEYLRFRYERSNWILKVAIDLKDRGQLEHICEELLELLRLSHGLCYNAQVQIPYIFLILDREDDCYNYVKWWMTRTDDYDWESPPESVEGKSWFLKSKISPSFFPTLIFRPMDLLDG